MLLLFAESVVNEKYFRSMKLTITRKTNRYRLILHLFEKGENHKNEGDILLAPSIVYSYSYYEIGYGRAISIKWLSYYVGISFYKIYKEEI